MSVAVICMIGSGSFVLGDIFLLVRTNKVSLTQVFFIFASVGAKNAKKPFQNVFGKVFLK
jgi:hypothetical protein